MTTYTPRETAETAQLDRSRLVLLPVALTAYAAGAVLAVLAVAALVALVLGMLTGAPLHLELHPDVPLPGDATDPSGTGGAVVTDGTQPVLTGVLASVSGASAATAFALRLAPVVTTAAFAAAALLGGFTVQRVGRRSSASRPLLVAAIVLAGGSAIGQAIALVAVIGLGPIAWNGVPQIDHLAAVTGAGIDPAPFAVAAGLLVAVHLLRRLEGSGVLVPERARRRGRR